MKKRDLNLSYVPIRLHFVEGRDALIEKYLCSAYEVGMKVRH